MSKLIYSMTTSLDGYVADLNGNFDWAEPSEEVHIFINNILKNIGTFLFGRTVYETMAVWETITPDGTSEGMNQFANIWKSANKIIYSTSLSEVVTDHTTIERSFNADLVRKLIAESNKDFGIGGPHLAAEAMKAGIIDEYHQFIVPVIIGNGNHWLPKDLSMQLDLVNIQKFVNGTVHLEYSPK